MVRAILLGSLLCASPFRLPSGDARMIQAQVGPGSPDTLMVTVAEARRLTLAQNPTFLGTLERVAAARGDLRGARTYPLNPEIEIESPGSLTGGSGLDAYEIRFGQEIEWAGQRGLRITAAEAGLSGESSRVLDEARRVLSEVEVAYVTLSSAEQRLALAEQIQGFNEQLLEAVRTQLAEGEVSVLQANLAEIEAARGRARVLASDTEVSSAALDLGRLLGLSAESVLRTAGTTLPMFETQPIETDQGQHLSAALEARPDLAASLWGFEQSGSLRSLASREWLPNLKVGTIADRSAGRNDLGYGLFFGISLPVFQRNQGLRSRRDAEFREASMGVLALELQVRQEVADALQSFQKASRELEVFEENVLGPARQNQGLLDTAYSEGKLDLSSLLLLRNQLLDAEMEYWGAWERRQKASIDLRKATAAILDGALVGIEERIR